MNDQIDIIKPDPATTRITSNRTEVGSVFVSNYPPYSFWREEDVPEAVRRLNSPHSQETALGLYLHIPFCRKRCKFCYFKVYTDKNSSEIESYLEALSKEVSLYARMPAIENRPLTFVYFGGGTPSYISVKHLKSLADSVKASIPWDDADEVAFECEPGTLTQTKLEAIKEIGVTRLSLGIENLNDRILEENGRAHLSKEVFEVMPWIEKLEFDQLNVDLIAGMLGETWQSWRDTVQKTIDLDADSVTVYQMELPFNTLFSKHILDGTMDREVADWETKRAWHNYAFEQLEQAGYEISSTYTMVKNNKTCKFIYRDAVWNNSDMIDTGVASFSHLQGVHFQNVSSWDRYMRSLKKNLLPLHRAYLTTADEQLTRSMILQLKLGSIDTAFFRNSFDVDVLDFYGPTYKKLQAEGMLTFDKEEVRLTRKGFFQVDQLLPEFYDAKYQDSRYT